MKVLLISPKDPDRPGNLKFLMGGEDTYTRSLLENPPPGVKYVHHSQALKEDKIAYTFLQQGLSSLINLKILPPDAGFQCLLLKEKFDLIHCHGYCLHLKTARQFLHLPGERKRHLEGVPLLKTPPRWPRKAGTPRMVEGKREPPVILSDSSSNYLFLKDYLGWSEQRIKLSYGLRGLIHRKLNIYDPNLNLYKAKKLIVWSNFAKKVHQDLGCNGQKIVVIPPGIEKLPTKKVKHHGFNILFVGIWFKRKGGNLLLKAYKILKEKYPEINLTLIGQLPKDIKLPKDVWHKDYLPREKLMAEIFPKADVLVLVPPVAEGYGLVVNEAASLGIPSIVSRVYALPELVEDEKNGFIISSGSLEQLTKKLEILIKNPSLKEKMGKNAQKRFLEKFWIKKTNEKLLKIYQEAIES